MTGMPGQEWAITWPNYSAFILSIPRTFPQSFIEIWWTKIDISWKTFILQVDRHNFRPFFRLLPILPHFGHFCQIWLFREKFYNSIMHHFRPFPAKSLDSILFKSPKTSFLGYFGLFWAQIPKNGPNGIFFEKSGFVTFLHLWPPNFM